MRIADCPAFVQARAMSVLPALTADRERRFWQLSQHPEALRTEKFWRQKLDYLYENPCRKGLVTRAAYWRYSSAAYYVSDGMEICDVQLSAVE